MKDSLVEGLNKTHHFTVDRDRTIGFMGDDLRVYATPSLVRDVEETCRDLILEHMDGSEDSVGTRVEVNHTAPTLLDMRVEVTATVNKVQGRLVSFDFVVRDGVEQVADGTHTRFVVDKGKTAERLAAKAAQAGAP